MIPLAGIRRRSTSQPPGGRAPVPGGQPSDGPAPGTVARTGGPGGAGGRSADDRLAAAWDALATVCDPELGLDLVALGLVYDVRDEGGTVEVTMTLTTPGCPASESLPVMARMAVEEALSGAEVRVDLVWEPPWSPALITDEAAAALGFTSG